MTLPREATRQVIPDVTATSIVAAMAKVRTVPAMRVWVAEAEIGITVVSRRASMPLQRSREGEIPGSACDSATTASSSRTSAAQLAHSD